MMSFDILRMTDQPETCRQCGTRTNFMTMRAVYNFTDVQIVSIHIFLKMTQRHA
jgi:hypothetical protein